MVRQTIPSMQQILNQILSISYGASLESHSYQVSVMAKEFGEYLGLCQKSINKLIIGGVLHDIGKVSYDDDLLNGNVPIDEQSKEKIYNHTIVGLSLVSHHIIDQSIREIILYHHERYDGQGYPFGLMGDEIPFLVKIISIVDAYDAMTTTRGYNMKRTKQEAIKEINACAGTQFDPQIAKSFIQFLKQAYPIDFRFLS